MCAFSNKLSFSAQQRDNVEHQNTSNYKETDIVFSDVSVLQLPKMQNQMKIVQQRVLEAAQMTSQAIDAAQKLASSRAVLVVADAERLYGKDTCSQLQSLDNFFAAHRARLIEQNKSVSGISYLFDEGPE